VQLRTIKHYNKTETFIRTTPNDHFVTQVVVCSWMNVLGNHLIILLSQP